MFFIKLSEMSGEGERAEISVIRFWRLTLGVMSCDLDSFVLVLICEQYDWLLVRYNCEVSQACTHFISNVKYLIFIDL